MALGTCTLVSAANAMGPVFIDTVTLVGDAAYPTNGSLGLAAKVKALHLDSRAIVQVVQTDGAAATMLVYDQSADKLKAFVRTTGVEVANATDLSGTTFKLTITSV